MNGEMKGQKKVVLDKNLQRLIKENRMTITTAAKKVGMNKSTLHNYCNGLVPRHIMKIMELAETFGVTLNDLFYEKEGHPNSVQIQGQFEGKYEITVKRLNGFFST